MAHIRKPLAAAVALNTAVFLGEAATGLRAGSLSLLTDAVHNLSDELALICLFLAYVVSARMSRGLQRSANLLNSLGLVSVSAVIVWQAVDRLHHPRPVIGWLPVAVGLFGVAGNWGVARMLRPWRGSNPAIRLAYIHNLGDMYVSLAPVAAGVLVSLTGRSVFDPLLALGIGGWFIFSTLVELGRSGDALLWPEDAACPHGSARPRRIETLGSGPVRS